MTARTLFAALCALLLMLAPTARADDAGGEPARRRPAPRRRRAMTADYRPQTCSTPTARSIWTAARAARST